MCSDEFSFVDLYSRLFKITENVFHGLTSNGTEVFFILALTRGYIRFGIDEVVSLLPNQDSARRRDHLIAVHFAVLESLLYRHGYVGIGHAVRILSGNYSIATEEIKQSTIINGFDFRAQTVSSSDEFIALTPLRRPNNTDYAIKFEKLVSSWRCSSSQKKAAQMMESRLSTIHDLLPVHKIGHNLYRERRGKKEPLPLFIRNEIHHPTIPDLLESETFEQDKSIAYAIMCAWLSEDDSQETDSSNRDGVCPDSV